MDAERFDRIAVVMGGTVGRRATVRLLASGIVSVFAGSRGAVVRGQAECAAPCQTGETCKECVAYAPCEADTFPRCPVGPVDTRYRCCPRGQHNANGLCCQEENPPAVNCCTVADAEAGRCEPKCLTLTERPGQDPVLVDDAHCRVCGRACTGGKRCVDGECVCRAGTHNCGDGVCRACCNAGDCDTGQRCCDGVCQSCCLDTDCSAGRICREGGCRCPSGQHDCGGTCQHCCGDEHCTGDHTCQSGGCACPPETRSCGGDDCATAYQCCSSTECAGGKFCPGAGGVCTCPDGQRDCGGRCVARDRCCTNADCTGGKTCPSLGGVCGCVGGLHECNGVCRECCVDADCGGGQHCPAGACTCPPGTRVCGGGICAPVGHCCDTNDCAIDSGKICPDPGEMCRCPDDREECDGVCIDTLSDPGHCGTCGNACPSGGFCSGGRCACPDFLSTNCGGVCTNLQSNDRHCGSCGTVCGEQQQCLFGTCVFDPGPITCDPAQCRPPSYCWGGRCVSLKIPDDLIPVWVLE